MMGRTKQEQSLFSYQINLEQRVRAEHPLRKVAAVVDFSFVREEVAQFYGYNGHESVAPEVIMKMMFLLFWDNVESERELLRIIPERLDYLWFLGYQLDDVVPDHSVLSKARRRWGKEVFERLFVQTVGQCLAAGLVDGRRLHVDSSLVDANASRDSVIKGPPELIGALKAAYQATESKLAESATPESYEAVNDTLMSRTDPDAALVRKGGAESRPRYHHHRAVDDAHGVITAVETTPGSIAENRKLLALIDQHEANTRQKVESAVADHKYGTIENYVACQQRGITTYLGDAASRQHNARCQGIFPDTAFSYDSWERHLSLSGGRDAAPAPLPSHPPHEGIRYWQRRLCSLPAALPMHARNLWAHGQAPRASGSFEPSAATGAQPCRAARAPAPATLGRSQFCRRHQ